MTRVVVAGAGLAGLTAARHLADAGLDVQVLERREAVGGRVRSVERDGFVLDRGFQVLFTAYPAVKRELDLDALDLRTFTPGATIAEPNGRSVLSDPLRDLRSLPETLTNPYCSLLDGLRVFELRRDLANESGRAILAGAERGDVSIASYLADRGFSRRFVDGFVAPFYGGITLDRSLSTSKAVFEYTFKALAAGDAAVPAAGMGAVSEQLADRARAGGGAIDLGTTVEAIDADDTGAVVDLGGETIEAAAVVVATDPPTARDLTGVESIPTEARGCVTQYYSLPTDDHPDTGKRLLLNARDAFPNEVAPLSRVAPEYAPTGYELLSATFLPETDRTADDGRRSGERPANDRSAADGESEPNGEPRADGPAVLPASDRELAEATRWALSAWYPERRFDDLEPLHTDRIPFAQFAQPPGFRASLPGVDAPEGRAYLAGEYTEWSSIDAALESGRRAARAVLDDL